MSSNFKNKDNNLEILKSQNAQKPQKQIMKREARIKNSIKLWYNEGKCVNPNNPSEVANIPGPSNGDYYYHRDYKTFGDYLYIVNEMTGPDIGMQVIVLYVYLMCTKFIDKML